MVPCRQEAKSARAVRERFKGAKVASSVVVKASQAFGWDGEGALTRTQSKAGPVSFIMAVDIRSPSSKAGNWRAYASNF